MMLTRATDNRLKAFFTGGEVRYGDAAFQGKGFRSLGQEAIYAAGIRLRRGDAFRASDGAWRGDVVAPLIRDLGVALAMRPDGRDRAHGAVGADGQGRSADGRQGPAHRRFRARHPAGRGAAGDRHADDRRHGDGVRARGIGRVALSFIGEGGSSLGEWHEAINLCAARRLPAVFCVQNNQTALSTPVRDQSAVRVFADKAAGYGIPGITIDGTDPDEIAAAFAWAVERARAGDGPALIELVCMRMCGHAHHDDMLYLGKDPQRVVGLPAADRAGLRQPGAVRVLAARDPIAPTPRGSRPKA